MKQATALLLAVIALLLFAGAASYPRLINGPIEYANKSLGLGIGKFPDAPFKLGLDLQGGTHLVYHADVSGVADRGLTPSEALESVRGVIEKRVNLFGVTEPIVQIEKTANDWRLIVELAGVTDVNQAIKLIGETPFLEFRTQRPADEATAIQQAQLSGERLNEDPLFIPTELTGAHLRNSQLQFDSTTNQPIVGLTFDNEGARLFETLTRDNLGKQIAIYLDGAPISAPTVQTIITGGQAVITGNFTLPEAQELASRLNAGALPVPIELLSQQTVGPSLGKASLDQSVLAGLYGTLLVAVFMVLFYRASGVVAVIALAGYVAVILAMYKIVPVTLTLAGIAGFILTIGMAVDGNIIVFERTREELKQEKTLQDAVRDGFARAWTSIRDGHFSTLITAIILYMFGTSFVKGFALTLGIGVIISLFSSIFVTRILLAKLVEIKWITPKWL